MKKIKYRDFDYSTNIIITTKVGNYTAYKGGRVPTIKSSIKKMEPINIKIFDNPKKNNRILSKNDRVDLYLEGDQVPP